MLKNKQKPHGVASPCGLLFIIILLKGNLEVLHLSDL